MKAITLIQPWASLIADGRESVETRSWPTKHRGPFAIHAGAKIDVEACDRFGYDPLRIPTRCIVATAELADCVRFPHPSAPPDEYGDFSPGRYGFLLRDLRALPEPIPAKGSLGLWEWEPPNGDGELPEEKR